jgi:hypothetical protein
VAARFLAQGTSTLVASIIVAAYFYCKGFMKTHPYSNINNALSIIFPLILAYASGFCLAQYPSQSAPQATEDYTVTQVGPHSLVWGNSAGQTVTEIATGMNYWDGNGWAQSNPFFAATPDGTAFVAAQIQDPTRLAANLNVQGAVTVTTPDNVTLSSTPIAIGLYDAASGQSVIVATLTNCTGVQADPQDIVYDHALVGGGFAASVVYSVPDTASFHQDVVFVGFNPTFNPTNWGFAETTTNTLLIQIFTEFYDPPKPMMLTNVIYSQQNEAIRANMASPDLIDYTLDFGDYVFGPGQAYTSGGDDGSGGGVPVVKDFVTQDGRTFLIESVPYQWLANALHALPPVAANNKSPARPASRRTMLASASMPTFNHATTRPVPVPSAARRAVVSTIPVGRPLTASIASASFPKPGILTGGKPRGVVVDYVVTVSSTVKPTLFAADTTYFVSGNVVESSAVTMESAVFKFPTNKTSGMIEIESTLTMSTTNYRPAIFTAADDNTAGAALNTTIWSNYTGNPTGKYYGEYALDFNTTANISLNNIRFAYQNCAILFNSSTTANQTFNFTHSQLVDCVNGLLIDGTTGGGGGGAFGPLPPVGSVALSLNADNCLMGNVQYPFEMENSNSLAAIVCNCTIDLCTKFINVLTATQNTAGTFKVTNSIVSNISSNNSLGDLTLSGGDNAFYSSPTFGSSYTTLGSNPYESIGAGNYYLPSTSSLLALGTTNVGSALLSQLQMKTVIAPLTLTNLFTNYTMLTPVVQRDTTGMALGFHYDPIDYLAACTVSNAVLLLTNGVALAYYDNLGIWLQDGSQLISQGTPNYRNYLAYYGLVQEQPGVVTNVLAQALPIAPAPYGSSANPSVFLRLTTICAPQGETNLLNTGDSSTTGQVISGLTLRDCEVYGAGAYWVMSESNNTPVVGFTNNVFHRVPFAISNNATMTSYNNLFYGTTNTNGFTITMRHRTGSSSPNTNENNVFDGVTASLDGTVGYNAYLHGGTNSSIQANDIVTNLTWQVGPLGSYYQTTNSPLLTNGSTYATNLGLYHYTVITNEAVEGTNIVSRGYHYVALGANGLPLDTNGDGVPDYLEDANGNGIVDSGEIDWLVSGDMGLTVSITSPVNNSTLVP